MAATLQTSFLLIFCCCCILIQNSGAQCVGLEKYVELSKACDFYFDGYHHLPPILELRSNTTLSPVISARNGVRVLKIGEIARCKSYLAMSETFGGVGDDCHKQFSINRRNQVEAHFGARQGALVDPLQASAIILFLDQLELEDGTCLTDGDRDSRYVESRRCVSFLAMPHFHTEVEAPALVMKEFMVFREKIVLDFIQTMRKIQSNLKNMIYDQLLSQQQLPS